MLHLPLSFRPTPVYDYMSRTKQMEGERNQEQEGGGNDMQAYLQLPENLWLATGLEVLQSLGPEAVFLVQGAIATTRADESMTMQEPEHESGTVVSRLAPLTKAVWKMQFGLDSLLGKSLKLEGLPFMPSLNAAQSLRSPLDEIKT